MRELDPRRQKLKDDFIAARGYWSALWDGVLELSTEFSEAYKRLSAVPWLHGTLGPKIREPIYIAIDVASTHLYLPGLRTHNRNVLGHGATIAEIMIT